MSTINNAIYHGLGERWYQAEDDPVALLRAESRWRNPWLVQCLEQEWPGREKSEFKILDVACGGGFLSNYLAKAGYSVTGIDAAEDAISVARNYDQTENVDYQLADAGKLPFESNSFDVVTMMDFLEHVTDPSLPLAEAKRVLRPGGLIFFHTFNRTKIAKWVAIDAVEKFVKNTPKDLHVIDMFIKPRELCDILRNLGFQIEDLFGLRPRIFQWALWRILWTGSVRNDFAFCRSRSLGIGYTGYGRLPR